MPCLWTPFVAGDGRSSVGKSGCSRKAWWAERTLRGECPLFGVESSVPNVRFWPKGDSAKDRFRPKADVRDRLL